MSLVTTLKKTGKKMGSALSGDKTDAADDAGTDVLDLLKKDHDDVKALLKKLVDGKTAAERKSLVRQIKAALVPHVRAEEKIVYDAIIALRDKQPKQDGEEGYLEHALADKTLAGLDKIANAVSPEFSAAAKVLKELIEHHVEEEESNVWSDVRKNFSDDERAEMGRKFEAAKKKVRVP
jgi:hemerythrin superfamily protein